jgi:hypothetical protein
MDMSSLPRYPAPSEVAADRAPDADRRGLLVRLLVHAVVWGFAVVALVAAAVALTGGQLVWLLRGGSWD